MGLPGVVYQQPTLAKPEAGVIYMFKGGFWKPWKKRAKAVDPWGFHPTPKVTNCWMGSESWPTRGLGHWRGGCASKRGK